MKKPYLMIALIAPVILLSGCGDSPEPVVEKKTSSHVWQSQTDALKEAQSTADEVSRSLQQREDNSRPTN